MGHLIFNKIDWLPFKSKNSENKGKDRVAHEKGYSSQTAIKVANVSYQFIPTIMYI